MERQRSPSSAPEDGRPIPKSRGASERPVTAGRRRYRRPERGKTGGRVSIIEKLPENYDLSRLGWQAFQDLGLLAAEQKLGPGLQIFSETRDGGRDGAVSGVLKLDAPAPPNSRVILQCKFLADAGGRISKDMVMGELAKIRNRVAERLCDVYILISNGRLQGTADAEIQQLVLACGAKHCWVWGYEWLVKTIREHKKLRSLVPRLYGLGDLSEILDERAYLQSQKVLDSLKPDLARFVPTKAYLAARDALLHHGFVLLKGEPGAGKTTTGATLAVNLVDTGDYHLVKVSNAAELVRHWNPNDPRQVFWIDDVFGMTQYEPDLARDWNRNAASLRAVIRGSGRIIATSRTYVYQTARSDLKQEAFPLLEESKVVIDTRQLTVDEKSRILYAHMKLGSQPRAFKAAIKPLLPSVAANELFMPEVARRLGDPAFTGGLQMNPLALKVFVERPIDYLLGVLRSLGRESLAALSLVMSRDGHLETSPAFGGDDATMLNSLGATEAAARSALVAMNGSLTQLVPSPKGPVWGFRHPTIRDALAQLLASDPERLDAYLLSAPVEHLAGQCAFPGRPVKGAEILVPWHLHALLASRIRREVQQHRDATGRLAAFLEARASPEFLRVLLKEFPGFVDFLEGWTPMFAHSNEATLLVRLLREKLVDRTVADRLRDRIEENLIEVPDPGPMQSAALREVLSDEAMDGAWRSLSDALLKDAETVVRRWIESAEAGFSPQDREAGLGELLANIETLKEIDAQRGTVPLRSILDEAGERVTERLGDPSEYERDPGDYDSGGDERFSGPREIPRSLFDDVDV